MIDDTLCCLWCVVARRGAQHNTMGGPTRILWITGLANKVLRALGYQHANTPQRWNTHDRLLALSNTKNVLSVGQGPSSKTLCQLGRGRGRNLAPCSLVDEGRRATCAG
jgi:hypothetical protein